MPDQTPTNIDADVFELACIVDDPRWETVEDLTSICANIAQKCRAVINYEGPLEASTLLTHDERVHELNSRFRNQQKATNVLSFPNDDEEPDPDTGALYLGDIAVSFDTVSKEAEEANKPLENHLIHMIVHGVLHLAGFDHETDQEAEEMERIEIEILDSFGISNPYQEI